MQAALGHEPNSCGIQGLGYNYYIIVRLNNLLRTILGVTWDGGRLSLDTNEIFSALSFLKLNSIFKLNLFKFLRLLLDGELPVF